jgi:Flp pilus assembly protein TadD
MKLDFSFRFTALWCACGLVLAGCAAEPVVQVVKKTDRLDRSLYQAAESFEKRRDYATAVTYYRNLYRRDASDISAIVGLSRGLRHLQQAREAQSIILRAMKEFPKNTDLRAELGKVQLAMGEPLKAIDSLSRVDAEIEGRRWDLKIAMAIAYDRLGMYEQAERRYHQALDLSPENAVVMNNFALSLAQAGRLAEAVGILERAAAMPEATPRMRQNLALLYAMKGDLTQAEAYVRRDMPPKIAEQNMAYYRQLRAGIAVDDKTAPPAKGRAMARAGKQAPNTKLPPAEVVASKAPSTIKPVARPAPPAMTKLAADPSKAIRRKKAGVKMAAPEKMPMTAPRIKAATTKVVASKIPSTAKPVARPAPPAMAKPVAALPKAIKQEKAGVKMAVPERKIIPARPVASKAMPAGKPVSAPEEKTALEAEPKTAAKMMDKDEGATQPAPMAMPQGGEQQAVPDRAAPEVVAALAVKTTQPAETPKGGEPAVKAEPADGEAALDPVKAAMAPAVEVSPSPAAKTPDAGAKALETKVASVAAVGYRLQLGSFRSMDGAETLRARLLKDHSELLENVELVVETVTVPGRGDFFRVNSRPVASREMVDETCLRLAIRDVPCLLVSVP